MRNSAVRFIAIGTALAAGLACQGADSTAAVVDRLAAEHLFAIGGIGIAGQTSDGEKNFRAIVSASGAEAAMERLFTVGSPEAKAYALLGMHDLHPKRFAMLAAPLYASKLPVATMRGCLMRHMAMSDLVRRIAAGEYSNNKPHR